jgi:cell wall-associated NlpC family hydrolase
MGPALFGDGMSKKVSFYVDAAAVSPMSLDPRLHAFRDDLADARLRGRVEAPRFVEGVPGRVVAGRAPVRREPASDAELLTFFHYGEPVLVYEAGDGFAWCQSFIDDYVGYVSVTAIAPTEAALEPTHYVQNLGAYTYEEPDLRSPIRDFLPRHCPVVAAETGLVTRGTEYARLDTGRFLPLGCLGTEPPNAPDIMAAAMLYLGCPYLWGGKSFLGIDCSGLVQNAFRDIGVLVLRDTDMQRDTIGQPISASSEGDLRPGDLLYIPGHVMIYAGEGDVIHADGVTMMVRRENLAALMRDRGLDWSGINVRRDPAAMGLSPAGAG